MQQFNNSASPQVVFTATLAGFYQFAVETTGFAHLRSDAGSVEILDTNAGPQDWGVCWLNIGDSVELLTSGGGSYTVDVRGARTRDDEL